MLLSVVLMSISLSLDAFFVGIAYGFKSIRVPLLPKLLIGLFSVVYAAAAMFLGQWICSLLPEPVTKYVGSFLLIALGIFMGIKGIVKKDDSFDAMQKQSQFKTEQSSSPRMLVNLFLKPLGITIQITKNPYLGDKDNSGTIDIKEALLLGIALSIDTLGVGIGSAILGIRAWFVPLFVGITQILSVSLGLLLGGKWKKAKQGSGKISSLFPALIIIGIGIFKLF